MSLTKTPRPENETLKTWLSTLEIVWTIVGNTSASALNIAELCESLENFIPEAHA